MPNDGQNEALGVWASMRVEEKDLWVGSGSLTSDSQLFACVRLRRARQFMVAFRMS
jgi:hypothetical protein